VIRYEYEHLPDHGYRFVYELSDGQVREEEGIFDKSVLVVNGHYAFTSTDGQEFRVDYTADENGFRVTNKDDEKQAEITAFAPPPAGISPNLIGTLLG